MGSSYKTCWPIWGDNHHCLDDNSLDANAIVKKYEAKIGQRGYHYHTFKSPRGNGGNGYFADPSGFQYQLDAQMTVPTDSESFEPSYCGTTCENAV
jgi:hypothetical protein